jgi:predicted membrane protein
METYNKNEYNTPAAPTTTPKTPSGRTWGGFIIIALGTILLLRNMGVDIPGWITSWPMILIAVGLYLGAKHRFTEMRWLIPFGIGSFFLVMNIVKDMPNREYLWPVMLICVGAYLVLRPKRTRDYGVIAVTEEDVTEDQVFEVVNVFGGSKRNVISKDFRGGEMVTIFGGSDVNFLQADLQKPRQLEIVQIFGGTKLVVPSDWSIQTSELVCIFGAIVDKRDPGTLAQTTDKVLVLKGVCIFGGIDIKSY